MRILRPFTRITTSFAVSPAHAFALIPQFSRNRIIAKYAAINLELTLSALCHSKDYSWLNAPILKSDIACEHMMAHGAMYDDVTVILMVKSLVSATTRIYTIPWFLALQHQNIRAFKALFRLHYNVATKSTLVPVAVENAKISIYKFLALREIANNNDRFQPIIIEAVRFIIGKDLKDLPSFRDPVLRDCWWKIVT